MDHLTKLEEMLNQANLEIKNGKYEIASNILEKIIDKDPNFGKAYNHLGYLYEVKFKEYEKGETLYKLCLEKSPMYPAVYYNYAVLLSTLRKYDALKRTIFIMSFKNYIIMELLKNSLKNFQEEPELKKVCLKEI